MLRRRRVTVVVALSALAALALGIVWSVVSNSRAGDQANEPQPSQTPHTEPGLATEPDAAAERSPAFDVDSPDSITVVVNKQRPISPNDWVPNDLVLPEGIANNWGDELRAPAAAALQEMYASAAADGLPFIITSGFRDYDRQAALFDGYAESDGVDAAETYSARPGHSEHQTGLAVDLTDGGECSLEECFGDTQTGQWLREHAWQFGFILRYDQGEEAVVGYSYEPWHFRYVGTDVSTAMHEHGVTNLEDYLGLPAAPGY